MPEVGSNVTVMELLAGFVKYVQEYYGVLGEGC
jgi:hypothetical protein